MIGVGLYGDNGHQVQQLLVNHPKAELIGVSQFVQNPQGARIYASLDEMLIDRRIKLVCLCSPKRSEQVGHAIKCLEAGKHVYAEKPCAMYEDELDRIIDTAKRTGMRFHEMSWMSYEEPYRSIRDIVKSGTIGNVVQVFAQKSYPYHADRPQDENIDGGLIRQVGIHALRLIEDTACVKIVDITAIETKYGNPVENGGLHMASILSMKLHNGGIAVAIANYLNQHGHGKWGNDHLRIFGNLGFVESVDGGARTRLVVGDTDYGEIKTQGRVSYFDMLIDSLNGESVMPHSLEYELSPIRMVLRAKQAAHE